MKKIKEFLIQMITSHSGISSKRVCGVVGWMVCLAIAIYCTIAAVQAPLVLDTILWCCMGLLGIDSIAGIFNKNKKHD